MNPLFFPLFLLLIISSVYGDEYQTNDHYLFLFSDKRGNVHENYAFCTNRGMNLVSLNTEKDENAARSQKNTKLDWIWIESTFRTPYSNESCPTKCCSLQIKAIWGEMNPDFRLEPCSEVSAYMACQQVNMITSYNTH